MENNINGKELNKKFINAIVRRTKKLFESAKPFIEASNADEVVEQIDENNYIKKEDKEEYDILMTLLTYVEFDREPAANTYEFKGLEYKSGKRTNRTSIFVSKENALKISRLANDYEEKLKRTHGNPNDMKMNIKFPVELLLLKYQGTNMPGLDYEAPEPKTANQTDDQYEEGLERYYSALGVEKVQNETANFREAYPHEKVNYRQDPPVSSNVVQSGYYDERVREIARESLNAEHSDPGLEPGEEQPITGTDRGLGRRIGDGLLIIKNIFKSKTLPRKLAKFAVLAGLGYTAVSCLITNPLISLLMAGGIAAVGTTAGFVIPKVRKGYRAIKKKIKEWLFGPELTQNPPQQQPEEPPHAEPEDTDDGGDDVATPSDDDNEEPTMTPDEINERIFVLNNEAIQLRAEIDALTAEIDALEDSDPEKANKISARTAKQNEYRAKLYEVTSLLHQNDVEHSMRGRGSR